jgi:hypothetical protein
MTVRVKRRWPARRSPRPTLSDKMLQKELGERLAFERWGELDVIAAWLARWDPVDDQLAHNDNGPERHRVV